MENGNGIRQRRAGIKSIALYLPADVLTDDELASELGEWDAQKILYKTGTLSHRHRGVFFRSRSRRCAECSP